MNGKCSICDLQITNREEGVEVPDKISYVFIDCPRCGKYKTTETSLVAIPGKIKSAQRIKPEARYIISHWIRKIFNETNHSVRIDVSQIERIVELQSLPNIAQQMNNLILFIGDNIHPYYSRYFRITLEACEATKAP